MNTCVNSWARHQPSLLLHQNSSNVKERRKNQEKAKDKVGRYQTNKTQQTHQKYKKRAREKTDVNNQNSIGGSVFS